MYTLLSPVHLSVSFFYPPQEDYCLLHPIPEDMKDACCYTVTHSQPLSYTHTSPHTQSHIQSILCTCVLQAVQRSICCYRCVSRSLFPHSVTLSAPSLSHSITLSAPLLRSFPSFLLLTNHSPASLFSMAPPTTTPSVSLVDGAIWPRGSGTH